MDERLDEEIALKERALKAWQRALEENEQLRKEKEWLLNRLARQSLEIDMGHAHYEGKRQHIEKNKIEIKEEMQQVLKDQPTENVRKYDNKGGPI